jgi:hypothetical protein
MSSEVKNKFEVSNGNLKVLESIPRMMIDPIWRIKLRRLVMNFLYRDIQKRNTTERGFKKR